MKFTNINVEVLIQCFTVFGYYALSEEDNLLRPMPSFQLSKHETIYLHTYIFYKIPAHVYTHFVRNFL